MYCVSVINRGLRVSLSVPSFGVLKLLIANTEAGAS